MLRSQQPALTDEREVLVLCWGAAKQVHPPRTSGTLPTVGAQQQPAAPDPPHPSRRSAAAAAWP